MVSFLEMGIKNSALVLLILGRNSNGDQKREINEVGGKPGESDVLGEKLITTAFSCPAESLVNSRSHTLVPTSSS